MVSLPKLVAVVGTNASGKSAIGVELAKIFNGEIISADSRQVYRGLDLGSGKITPEEMQGIRHHLIDILDPNEFFSMHDFQKLAYEAANDMIARGKLPFIVGGTGLYVESVTEGYVMSDREPDLKYRAELETYETPALYEMLVKAVPDIEIDRSNRNRVMRVLEKLHDGDDAVAKKEPRYRCLKLGVTWEREVLLKRIEERLDRRVREGMIEEVEGLMQRGATVEFLMKLGLEYRFITRYLIGEIDTKEEMLSLLNIAIRQFAKRQMIWFRRDKEIRWLDMTGDPLAEAEKYVNEFLAE